MSRYESLVVVGSSGAGKTTLVNGLRIAEFNDDVVIPKRFITRPPRQGDDLNENEHVSKSDFASAVRGGAISPYWQRPLDNGRVEQYGFASVDSEDSRLRVYSANNAFLRDTNPSVEAVLKSSLVIVALTSSGIRDRRLGSRSPDMGQGERDVRLSDHGSDLLDLDLPVQVIDTTQLSPDAGQRLMQSIVREVIL